MVLIIVHIMGICPYYGQLSQECEFVHRTGICPQYGQLSMAWTSYEMSTDCLCICPTRCFWPKLSTRFGFVLEDPYQSYTLSWTLPWGPSALSAASKAARRWPGPTAQVQADLHQDDNRRCFSYTWPLPPPRCWQALMAGLKTEQLPPRMMGTTSSKNHRNHFLQES